jgi:hypothetical protein
MEVTVVNKAYSLEYTNIPKTFLMSYQVNHCCTSVYEVIVEQQCVPTMPSGHCGTQSEVTVETKCVPTMTLVSTLPQQCI